MLRAGGTGFESGVTIGRVPRNHLSEAAPPGADLHDMAHRARLQPANQYMVADALDLAMSRFLGYGDRRLLDVVKGRPKRVHHVYEPAGRASLDCKPGLPAIDGDFRDRLVRTAHRAIARTRYAVQDRAPAPAMRS